MGPLLRREPVRNQSRPAGTVALAGVVSLFASGVADPAWAGLELCNQSSEHRSVAVGYSKDNIWTSEGWWNLDPGQCATPIQGDLTERYYYYRAETDDGAFSGDGHPFCTVTGSFTISGSENCDSRGYETEDFRRIDTGTGVTTFTHVISDPDSGNAASDDEDDSGASADGVVTGPADSGLRICNQTDVQRFVAIGYSKDDQWTSEGWWTLQPGQCADPVEGDLTQRYFYYRAEDPNEHFEGEESYTFCSVDDAYTIVGDENCEARGYKTLAFNQLDTGPEAPGYVLALTDETVRHGTGYESTRPEEPPGSDTQTGPSDTGLRICNQSALTRYVAIGYSKDDHWTSEGWWTLEPGECADPVEGNLTQRYYYYRAEDPDEQYDGEGYTFCTIDDAFTIDGDTECEQRGYEEHDFSEIDTGPEALGYIFVIQPGDGVSGETEAHDGNASDQEGDQAGDQAGNRTAETGSQTPDTQTSGAQTSGAQTSGTQTSGVKTNGPVTTLPSGDGVPPGTQGGPVDVTGVFLGCDPSETETLCTLRTDDALYTVVGSKTARKALENMLELGLFQKARVQGGILSQGDTSTEIFANTVTSQDVAEDDPTLELTGNGLQGGWQSLDDQTARIRFSNGRYVDYSGGDLVADGGYSLAMACPDSPNSAGEDPVIIVRLAGDSDPACYSVMYLDGTSLEMLALPRGNLLRYRRSD